jgi:hypothetical protein
LFIVYVFVCFKAEYIEACKLATLENVSCSVQETVTAHFDVDYQKEEPVKLVRVECYRIESDSAEHKKTADYQTRRSPVADMIGGGTAQQREVCSCTSG